MDDREAFETDAPTADAAVWGRYPRVMRAVAETPWAVLPGTLATIVDLLTFRAAGGVLTAEHVRERIGAGPPARQPAVAGAVAVIPLYGVLAPRATMMTQMSGGTSLQQFSAAVRQAANSSRIDSILLDVDSPGGMVDMVPEAAAELRAARTRKPVVAVANTDAASAAYWLAAQADELVVTPSGSVGSIGVFAAHNDRSRKLDMEGVTTTLISAGKHKVEGNPFEPLSEDARVAIQGTVDEYYGMFVADVAKGRRVGVAAVRDGFGEGRMVTANAAVRERMADRVDTFDATLARMLRARTPGGGAAAELERSLELAAAPDDTAAQGHETRELVEQIDGLREDVRSNLGNLRRG